MIKTHRVKLKLTKSQFELVREKQMECANRKTIAELRKKGDAKSKYPYKEKKFYIIPLKKQSIKLNKQGNLKLTLSAGRYLELDFGIENIKGIEKILKKIKN